MYRDKFNISRRYVDFACLQPTYSARKEIAPPSRFTYLISSPIYPWFFPPAKKLPMKLHAVRDAYDSLEQVSIVLSFQRKIRREDRLKTALSLSLSLSRCSRVVGCGDISTKEAGEIDFSGGGEKGVQKRGYTIETPKDNLEENAARRGEKRWNEDREARMVVKFTEETRDTWKATTKKRTFPRCPRISLYDCKNDPRIFLRPFLRLFSSILASFPEVFVTSAYIFSRTA